MQHELGQRNRVAVGNVLRTADSEGLKARKKIAQGKASPRATPWVNRPQNFQALKGRQKLASDSGVG